MSAKKLQEVSDEELINQDNFIDRLPFSGSSGPLGLPLMKLTDNLRRSLEMQRRLKKEIKNFNKQSSRYSQILIWLTIVMTSAVLLQIILLLSKA